MKISKSEIIHVAHLARLDMDDAAVDKFTEQIGTILGYIDKLNEVDTENVKSTSHAISITNAFRQDGNVSHIERDLALANAPKKDDGSFIVPKVVG